MARKAQAITTTSAAARAPRDLPWGTLARRVSAAAAKATIDTRFTLHLIADRPGRTAPRGLGLLPSELPACFHRPHPSCKPVTYAGHTYPSIAALAFAWALDTHTLKARLKSGKPLDCRRDKGRYKGGR